MLLVEVFDIGSRLLHNFDKFGIELFVSCIDLVSCDFDRIFSDHALIELLRVFKESFIAFFSYITYYIIYCVFVFGIACRTSPFKDVEKF